MKWEMYTLLKSQSLKKRCYFRGHSLRREYNIKIDIKETWCEDTDCNKMDQDRI